MNPKSTVIPEPIAELFNATPIGWGIIADRLENPLARVPAAQSWLPVITELVLRCDLPLQAAALAAVSEARQSASPKTLIFERPIRHTNAALRTTISSGNPARDNQSCRISR